MVCIKGWSPVVTPLGSFGFIMDIREKAHQFALESLSKQIEMIENAYLAGYNDAKGIIVEDGIEYVDLGHEDGYNK